MFVRIQALVILLLVALASPAMAEGPLDVMSASDLQKLVQTNKGKPVVVNFFATWCPPCRAEIPELVELHDKYKDQVVIIGLSVDSANTQSKILPFAAEMQINYPIYSAGNDLVQAFGVRSIPYNVGYGKDGKVAWAFSGFDGGGFDELITQLLK